VPQGKLSSLGSEVRKVRKARGDKTLRQAAREIEISPATLMRVESGRVPDVETFRKLCVWLRVDPAVYLGMKPAPTAGGDPSHVVVSAHFKADRMPDPDTVKALAKMIMFAVESGRQRSTISDGDT
jgi:transcriptional regulator with XRE-family HTH domain